MTFRPTAVVAAPDLLRAIIDRAERDYPDECCGLLSGSEAEGTIIIDEVHPSENLAVDRMRRFEVDPALRLRLQRTLRESGRRVIGIYHSHPDGPAQPSPRDLESAWEPDLVWLIVGMRDPQAIDCRAYFLAEENGATHFREMPLLTDGAAPPCTVADPC